MSDRDSNKFAGSVWGFLVTSIGAVSLMVGAVMWLSNVDSTAKEALMKSKETAAKLELLQSDVQAIKTQLAEIRVDIRYVVGNTEELKRRIAPSK